MAKPTKKSELGVEDIDPANIDKKAFNTITLAYLRGYNKDVSKRDGVDTIGALKLLMEVNSLSTRTTPPQDLPLDQDIDFQ